MVDAFVSGQEDPAPAGDLTLNAEVQRVCIVEGGYPDRWPRHRRCPCCGLGELRSLFCKFEFNHDQCINCGFVCVNPYPPEEIVRKLYSGTYYTSFREYYEARYLRETGEHGITAAPVALLEDMIVRATVGRAAGDWLDVGGGLGSVADMVQRRRPNWRVALNEFNQRSLELARDLYGIEGISDDPGALLKLSRRFDVISAVSVLEHAADPLGFLRSYVPLLRPGGIFVVIVPHFTHLNSAVSKAASPNATPPFHVSLFREQNLRLLLDRVGAFAAVETLQSGPPAFSLLHHYDFSDYWDISVPSPEEPVPCSKKLRDYPIEMAVGLNALGLADPAVSEHFANTDGRLYVMAFAVRPAVEGAKATTEPGE